jgi:hypothetical protein
MAADEERLDLRRELALCQQQLDITTLELEECQRHLEDERRSSEPQWALIRSLEKDLALYRGSRS